VLPPVSRRCVLGAVAGAVALTGPASGCSGQDWTDLPDVELTLATGNPGGVFDVYGEALATVLDDRLSGVTVRTVATDASVENALLVAGGEADLGFALGDTAADAGRGTGQFSAPLDLVALTRTYDSFVHVVVRADSSLTDVTDLRGRRVGLGALASGTRVVAQRVLREAGVGLGSLTPTDQALREDAEALAAGAADAFFFVSGLPNETIATLATDVPLRLLPLRDLVAPMVAEHGPEYVAGPIPAATYGLRDGVDTVSVKNYLVTRSDLDPQVAYAVTRVLFESQRQIGRLAPEVRQPNVAAGIFTDPLSLHPGAVRYFRELRE
jgi:TRAP transporter TAXI family solute receptor